MIKKGDLMHICKLLSLLAATLICSNNAFAQYKYTRFAIEGTAGVNYGLTSVPGSFAAFSEFGLRLSLSRYLSGKLTYGVGALRGSRTVNTVVFPLDDVNNYVDYNTTYRYLNGRALFNLERIFKLRQRSRAYNRLNPFLVIGGGFMFPDIEVRRVDGQFKNYKKNVRFYTNCYGLDFRYFLSNKFDLTFGSELHVIQTYYLDGAYSDKKLDKFITGHIGISYNIGANANRKHLEWFNLDGKEDVIFKPILTEPVNPQEPITQIPVPNDEPPQITKDDSAAIAIVTEPKELTPDSANTINELKTDDKDIVVTTVIDSSELDKQPKVITVPDPTKAVVDVNPGKPDTKVTIPQQSTHTDVNPKTEPKTVLEPTRTVVTAPKELTPEKPIIITPPLSRYNVIAATYGGPKYAILYCKKLRTLGFDANVIKSSKSKMYRISIYHGDDRSLAFKELGRIRKTEFKQAWIHIYNPQ